MLCLVAALQAEARPLIAHYKLEAIQGQAFRLYTGDGLRLIVSGIGKVAAAGAVAYQCALLDNSPAAWLNVGIAGHANKEVGSALLAHKITDTTNDKTFYPIFTAAPACPTSPLYTVDQAETTYATDCAYDMEASAFFETAQRFTSGELVHCLKIISDNPQNPIENFDLKKIAGLVESQLECIGQVAATLQELSQQLAELQATPTSYNDINGRWHFTVTQQHQLRGLLQRWQTLMPTRDIVDEDLLNFKKSNEVLHYLEQQLLQADLTLTETP